MTCAGCFHSFENHLESGVCNGSLTCMCHRYIPQELFDYAQEVEKIKSKTKKIYMRCKFILEKIPKTRNAGEKSFPKIYKEIWFGFKIRKEGTKYTTDEWNRMPTDDQINREKRRVKQHHPELKTYDPTMIKHQEASYQAYLELAIES